MPTQFLYPIASADRFGVLCRKPETDIARTFVFKPSSDQLIQAGFRRRHGRLCVAMRNLYSFYSAEFIFCIVDVLIFPTRALRPSGARPIDLNVSFSTRLSKQGHGAAATGPLLQIRQNVTNSCGSS